MYKATIINTQLSKQNYPSIFRSSLLNQKFDTKDVSDNESVIILMQSDKFMNSDINKLFDLLITNAKKVFQNTKYKKKVLQTDTAK